ncbi:MAG: hypothetical protein J4F39_04910, partial [Candidatus Latescibacteria bacterium]|nr:hypothetical protein [Candidatus Latescibacterota bacterium]
MSSRFFVFSGSEAADRSVPCLALGALRWLAFRVLIYRVWELIFLYGGTWSKVNSPLKKSIRAACLCGARLPARSAQA